MSARQDYASHVVRTVCCTGGQVCEIGQRYLLAAVVEERREEYLDHAETLYVAEKLLREHRPDPRGYFLSVLHWTGLDADAASISLDLAVAVACQARAVAAAAS